MITATPPFVVLYADPSRSAVTLEELRALPVAHIYPDAVLFLWVTAATARLPDALSVLDAWGFAYRTSAVWVAPRLCGVDSWFVRGHELVLLGKRGHTRAVHPPALRRRSVLTGPRRSVRDAAAAMFPEQRVVDLPADLFDDSHADADCGAWCRR